ncbi:hypothetical protein QYF61_010407 [Mycteria americana]|uniref:Uncharacterized protein n=1 Tax=Mycteria americana TaxID=33587 RepID=A0AAN7S328_MYCAM|nr:hypothetical protein QYF61_010407 [Mycteria americana]
MDKWDNTSLTLILDRISEQDYINRKLREGNITDVNHYCFMEEGPGQTGNWAERNLMMFNEGKYQDLRLGRNNPMHQHTVGAKRLESSSAEEHLVVLVDSKLMASQQCPLMAKVANGIPDCSRRSKVRTPAEAENVIARHLITDSLVIAK